MLPFSGQFLLEAIDLEMEGIGLDLCFERTYLHNTFYEGPLGRRWDHSYNLWLREDVEIGSEERYEHVVYRSNGRLVAQRFLAASYDDDPGDATGIADAVFAPSDGSHDRLVKADGRFVLVSPDGRRIEYNNDLRAETIRDRNDNTIRLVYDGEPSRVARIVDTCGRNVHLAYDDDGRLARIRDDAMDREIFYGYDDAGRLETVYRTTAPGKPPSLGAAYRYWAAGVPSGLEDNIVAVIDGRRREVLQIDYGTEPGVISYNRVVEQRERRRHRHHLLVRL